MEKKIAVIFPEDEYPSLTERIWIILQRRILLAVKIR